MKKRNHNFIKAIIKFVILAIIVVAIGSYFVSNSRLIGPVFLLIGFMNLIVLKTFKIKLNSIYPDIVFGAVDNSVLVFAAIIGGTYGGVLGAIIGGALGNTITDGLGGLFEGHTAESLSNNKLKFKRTALSSSLGKMTGCLFGGGTSLIILYLFSLI